MMQNFPGQHVFVCGHVGGSLALNAIVPGGLNATEQGRDNGRGNLVLNCENIVELSIVALGPDVCLCLAVNELNRHSDAVTHFAHAAFHHIVHAKFARDALRLHCFALVRENGIA